MTVPDYEEECDRLLHLILNHTGGGDTRAPILSALRRAHAAGLREAANMVKDGFEGGYTVRSWDIEDRAKEFDP